MNTTRTTLVALSVCAVLLAAGPADARAKKKKAAAPTPAAVTMPANPQAMMNGGVAQGAGGPMLLRHFDAIDTDKNGQLSRAEVEAWARTAQEQFRQRTEERVKAADTDGDGQLSREEARLGLPQLYERFEFVDANGDGFVTRAELEQLRDRDQMQGRIQARLQAADSDRDGKLNLAEVQVAFPGIAARFQSLDKNGDGYLTRDDLVRMMGPH